MQVLESSSDRNKWRKRLNLSGQFAKVGAGMALPGILTMAASSVFPPAGFIIPVAFMVGSHISLGYKAHKQKIKLEDNGSELVGRLSLSSALKEGIREKFKRLRDSAHALKGIGSLADQEREKAALNGETIGRVSSYLRAGKKNIGHMALIGGSVLALGLKLSGLGGGEIETLLPEVDVPEESGTGPDTSQDPEADTPEDTTPPKTDPETPAPSSNEEADTKETNTEEIKTGESKPDDSTSDTPVDEDTAPKPAENEDSQSTQPPEETGSSRDEMQSAIIEAGMPVVEDMDLGVQYRLAELLPTLEGMSDESRQYFEELYDRMDSDNPFVQGQAVKDYADMVLNCLGGIDGLDNKALAFDMICEAEAMAGGTNCQVTDFKAYMLLHGIGTDADAAQAVELLMESLTEHSSAEAARLLSYICESGSVDPADHPGLEEMYNAMMEAENTPEANASAESNLEASTQEENTHNDAPSKSMPEDGIAEEHAQDNNEEHLNADDVMKVGDEFTIIAGDGTQMDCTVEQQTTIAQAAVDIGHNNNDDFACVAKTL